MLIIIVIILFILIIILIAIIIIYCTGVKKRLRDFPWDKHYYYAIHVEQNRNLIRLVCESYSPKQQHILSYPFLNSDFCHILPRCALIKAQTSLFDHEHCTRGASWASLRSSPIFRHWLMKSQTGWPCGMQPATLQEREGALKPNWQHPCFQCNCTYLASHLRGSLRAAGLIEQSLAVRRRGARERNIWPITLIANFLRFWHVRSCGTLSISQFNRSLTLTKTWVPLFLFP